MQMFDIVCSEAEVVMERKRGFEVCKGYEEKDIALPVRKTRHAAAYDLEAAEDTVVPSLWKTVFANFAKFLKGDSDYEEIRPTLVQTGLKAYFDEEEVLILANRSSGPLKKGLVLANSIGIIDSDYYSNPSNDGNIMYAFYNFFPMDLHIKKHDAIGQAYFQQFLKIDGDTATDERQGGFGSTNQ